MGFNRKQPKLEPTPEPPKAEDPTNRIAAGRRRRMAAGGLASTLIGAMGQSAAAPAPTLTGVGG